MQASQRLDRFGAEVFASLNNKLLALKAQGKTIYNMSVGTPDFKPYDHVVEALTQAAQDPEMWKYALRDLPELKQAVCDYYERRFGVSGITPSMVQSCNGTQEGVGHLGLALLDPGDTPLDNLQFIVFLTAVIEAVDNYQELLRASVASAGNDHRLGANEAPPAIMSIFLGDQLTEVVEKIIDGKASVHATRGVLDLGADTLPKLMQDNTDRNRTSPFAFTGNKFEFRACGSEQNVSDSNLVLDAAVAKSLKSFADALEGTPEDEFQDAALEYCKKVLTDHQRILFSGDGYSDEWPIEAEKRGLANNKTTADALPAFVSDKAIALFEETGVLTKAEAQCRYDCKLEKYNKLMNIEATTMVREARRTYRPVITAYATKVAKGLETIRAAGAEAAMQCEQNTLNKLCNGITTINDSIKALDAVHQKAEALDGQEQANVYAHEVVPAMDTLRAAVDAMEEIVAADYWPVPTYDDILFYV